MAYGLEIYDEKGKAVAVTSSLFVLDYFKPTAANGSRSYTIPVNTILNANFIGRVSGNNTSVKVVSNKTVTWENLNQWAGEDAYIYVTVGAK